MSTALYTGAAGSRIPLRSPNLHIRRPFQYENGARATMIYFEKSVQIPAPRGEFHSREPDAAQLRWGGGGVDTGNLEV